MSANLLNTPSTRRQCLTAAAAVGLTGSTPGFAATEPPPETTRIRLIKLRSICVAPQYVAEELFRAEGFADIQYLDPGQVGASGLPAAQALGAGAVDISVNFAAPLVMALDEGHQSERHLCHRPRPRREGVSRPGLSDLARVRTPGDA